MQRDPVGLGRDDHLVDHDRGMVDAEHPRDGEAPHVGVDHGDLAAPLGEGDRQVGRHRRLARPRPCRRRSAAPGSVNAGSAKGMVRPSAWPWQPADAGGAGGHRRGASRRSSARSSSVITPEVEVDTVLDAVERGRPRCSTRRLDLVAQRAAGHGEDDLQADRRTVHDDVTDHPELDDRAVQLGVLHGPEGLDDVVGRDGHAPIVPGFAVETQSGRTGRHRAVRYHGGVAAPLSPTEFASAVTAITSAFGDPTRREIYLYVHDRARGGHGGDRRGEVRPPPQRGPPPPRQVGFRWLPGDHHRAPRRGSRTTVQAVPRHRWRGHPRRARAPRRRARHPARHGHWPSSARSDRPALAEEVGEEYGRHDGRGHGRPLDHQSFRSALHTVADALSAHGFAAHAEKEGNKLRIVTEHCPFGDAGGRAPRDLRRRPRHGEGHARHPLRRDERRREPLDRPRRAMRASPTSTTERPWRTSYLDHASTSPCGPRLADAIGRGAGCRRGRPAGGSRTDPRRGDGRSHPPRGRP